MGRSPQLWARRSVLMQSRCGCRSMSHLLLRDQSEAASPCVDHWHGSGSSRGRLRHELCAAESPTPVGPPVTLFGLEEPMRSLRLLAAATTVLALVTACGDNGGNVEPNQPPSAAFTAPSCVVSTPCQFTDASTDDHGIATRDWDFGDGST